MAHHASIVVLVCIVCIASVSHALTINWNSGDLLNINNQVFAECGQTLMLVWNNSTGSPARSVWRTPTAACPDVWLDNRETGLQQMWATQPEGRVSIAIPQGVFGVFHLADSVSDNCAQGTQLTVFVRCSNGNGTYELPSSTLLSYEPVLQASVSSKDIVIDWNKQEEGFRRRPIVASCSDRLRFEWNDAFPHSLWMNTPGTENPHDIADGANHRGGGCPTFSSTNPALAQLVGETANATEKVVTISSPLLYHIEPELGFNLFFYDGADDNCVARGGQQRVLVLCKPDDTVRELVPNLPDWDDSAVLAALEKDGPYSSPAPRGPRTPSPKRPAALPPTGQRPQSGSQSASTATNGAGLQGGMSALGATVVGVALLLALL